MESLIENPKYELKNNDAPKLGGLFLKLAVILLETDYWPILCIQEYIMKKSGFNRLRELDIQCGMTTVPIPNDLQFGQVATKDQISKELKKDFETITKNIDEERKTFFDSVHELWKTDQEEILGQTDPSLVKNDFNSEVNQSSLQKFHHLYMNGRVTPLDVARNIIKLYKEKDEKCNGLIDLNEEQLLLQAEESTKRYQTRKPLSILDGVPFVVKDSIDVQDYITRSGLKHYLKSGVKSTVDSATVERLKSLGAIVAGKTNMAEIGIDARSLNPHYGYVKNPYNTQHEAGGSSSGSAALVSANFVPMSLGTDGGSSIRNPASLCGVYGLKPTHARVPINQSTKPGSFSVTVQGPIATDAITLTVMYAAISGQHPSDSLTSIQPPTLGLSNIKLNDPNFYSLKGLRVGYYKEYFNDVNDKEITQSIQNFLDTNICGKYGANVVQIALPLLEELRVAHQLTIATELLSSYSQEYSKQPHLFSYPTRLTFHLISKRLGIDFVNAQRIRHAALEAYKKIFDKVDVIILPSTGITAPKLPLSKIGESDLNTTGLLMRFAFVANFLGLPAISIPVGLTKNGLPIGMQFMSKWWNEDILLKLAILSERQLGVRKQPKIYYELLTSPIEQRIQQENKKQKEIEERQKLRQSKIQEKNEISQQKKEFKKESSQITITSTTSETLASSLTSEISNEKDKPNTLEPDLDETPKTDSIIDYESDTDIEPETPKTQEQSQEDRARQKRLYAMAEFLTTERTYVRNLVILQERFINPLKSILSEKEHKQLFGHLDTVLNTNTLFLSELEKVLVNSLPQDQQEENLANLMLRISQMFKLYTPYISEYNQINQLGTSLMKKNKKFEELCNNAGKELKKEKHTLYTFFGFMITPIQRIPRMRLLLDEILKNTSKSTSQYSKLEKASAEIGHIASYCNDKTRESENMGKLLELDRNLKLNIVAPHRKFVDEMKGTRTKGNGRVSKCKAYLFNDLLVVVDSSSLSALGLNSPKQITLDVDYNTSILPMPNSKSIVISYETFITKTRSRRISLKLTDLENIKEDEKQTTIKKLTLNFSTEKQAKDWEKKIKNILI